MSGLTLRDSDSSTIDLAKAEAEIYDTTALARRVILVSSSGTVIKSTRTRENLAGSAGTGSDGAGNRVYTLTTTSSVDIVEVFLDGVLLVENSQYTIDNTTKKVTVIVNVFNTQTVTVFYNI